LLQIEALFKEKTIIIGVEKSSFFNRLTLVQNEQEDILFDENRLDLYFNQLQKILEDVFVFGIIDEDKKNIPGSNSQIIINKDRGQETKNIARTYEIDEATDEILNRLRNQFGENNDSVSVGYAILENLVSPNLFFDKVETDRKINEAISNVPTVKYRILNGERIIDSRVKVEPRHIEILNALAKEIAEREKQDHFFAIILVWIGKLFLIILTLAPLIVFLYYQRRRVWDDRRIMFMILSSMLFIVIISSIVLHYQYPKFLIPIAAVPIIVTSYQDTRSGFFVGLSLSLLIGAQNGNDFEITLIGLLTSAAAIFALGFSKYRKRLANSSIFIFIAYFFAISVLGIIRFESFNNTAAGLGSAVASSIFASLIAYSFILIFDAVFDVASEFKLIELSDLNNPLLKMFSIRSPGSYHHSLQVSNISEAAAEAIGANALLTKVGAYYHDLGKMFMPEYFVENQKGGKNPHDRLTPRISSLILINHVRKGFEFATENKLPSIVCKFITEHHGSSLMQFFYEKAKKESGDSEVLENDFRYPGTKPQSKETGILMLADSVEATVRSIKEPTLSKIRNAIRNVVDGKIQSGELEDCPLTMKDLGIIVEVFSNVLLGIHHDRLEYPGQQDLFKRPVVEMAKNKVV
jgi:putative nucleotidyltransferase with HDIG domain